MLKYIKYYLQYYFYSIFTNLVYYTSAKYKTGKAKDCLILTSYPKRYDVLGLTIKSLLNQTLNVQVYLVIHELHIDLLKEKLPILLRHRRISIICTKNDTKSYKKIDCLKNIPNDYESYTICDDDVYYPLNFVKRLKKELSNCNVEIACGLAHRFEKRNNTFTWQRFIQGELCSLSIMNGVAGITFRSAEKRRMEKQIEGPYMELCPNNDDLWISLYVTAGMNKSSLNRGRFFNWILEDPNALYKMNSTGRLEKELIRLLDYYA